LQAVVYSQDRITKKKAMMASLVAAACAVLLVEGSQAPLVLYITWWSLGVIAFCCFLVGLMLLKAFSKEWIDDCRAFPFLTCKGLGWRCFQDITATLPTAVWTVLATSGC
jgi:hypothetical protein